MSCRQAPGDELMTVGQVEKFLKESIDNKIVWEKIRVSGGEATLHPRILDILNTLVDYKKRYAPALHLQLTTNGFGQKVKEVLALVPGEFRVANSAKESALQVFQPFNLAPVDSPWYKFTDFSNACWITCDCGIGLTPYGYYHCIVAGGIDRIFGFDTGRKKLPDNEDTLIDQMRIFCRLCGHFRRHAQPVDKEIFSPTWKEAYERYKKAKPSLVLY